MQQSVEYIGEERQPILILDYFCEDIAALREQAYAGDYRIRGKHYPGLRAPIEEAQANKWIAPLHMMIAETFGLAPEVALLEAAFSIVTTAPHALTPIQRLPHFDGFEEERLAFLLYMSEEVQGGTAFYRHRSTGFESITRARYKEYDSALQQDVARHGLPPPNYVSGDTPLFQHIHSIAAKPNRTIIYKSNSLHCAHLAASTTFSTNPREARLTANLFLMSQPKA